MVAGGKKVSVLDDRGELNEIEHFYFSAFNYLSPSRISGMGINAIPLADYVFYVDTFGCPDSFDSFARIIRQIDIRTINEARESQK